MKALYRTLDLALGLLHLAIIAFCIGGWLPVELRPLHLALIILIALSWFGLGSCYGFGFCWLTDMHWRVKRRLGEISLPNSYIKYILDRLGGRTFEARSIDRGAQLVFFIAAGISLYLNLLALWAPGP